MSATARQTLNGSGHCPGDEPINLLRGLNVLGLDWRAHENPDGNWRAQCPVCYSLTPEVDLPLTVTHAGHLRCRHGCDPAEIADTPFSAAGVPLPTPRTDLGNAQRFAPEHASQLRHVPERRMWLSWSGIRWQRDATGDAQRAAKQTVRRLFEDAAKLEDDERKAVGA